MAFKMMRKADLHAETAGVVHIERTGGYDLEKKELKQEDEQLYQDMTTSGTVHDAVFGEQQKGGPNYRSVREYINK